jgi:hypothetical protein
VPIRPRWPGENLGGALASLVAAVCAIGPTTAQNASAAECKAAASLHPGPTAAVDPRTLEQRWRTRILDPTPAGQWSYPGVMLAHGIGFLYAGAQVARSPVLADVPAPGNIVTPGFGGRFWYVSARGALWALRPR